MKYNVKEIHRCPETAARRFSVSAGHGKIFTKSVTTDRDAAHKDAAHRSAIWHVEQALKLIEDLDLTQAHEIGHEALHLVDRVSERDRDENPNHSTTDPQGWAC
jgi:hypothetical protein